MRKIEQIIALILILSCFALTSKQISARSSFADWKQISSRNFVFIIADRQPNTAAYIRQNAARMDRLYDALKLWFPKITHPVYALITPYPAAHNGLATPFPVPYIVVHSTPPAPNSSIGDSIDPLYLTLAHELAHMAHLSSASEFYQGLRHIFGTAIAPAALVPLWLTEGFAVWLETRGSLVGRGRSSYYQGLLELYLDNWPRIEDIDVFMPYLALGSAPYFFGYLLVHYLAVTYGHEQVMHLVQRTGHLFPFAFISYPILVKDVFGKSLEQILQDARAYYLAQSERPAHSQALTPMDDDDNLSQSRPVVLENHLYYWERKLYDTLRLRTRRVDGAGTPRTLWKLSGDRYAAPLLAACAIPGRIYGVLHELSSDGDAPRLVSWTPKGRLRHHAAVPARLGKVTDIACHDNALYALTFNDLDYYLIRYDPQANTYATVFPFLRDADDVFPVQIVPAPDAVRVLFRNPQTLAYELGRLDFVGNTTRLPRRPIPDSEDFRVHHIAHSARGWITVSDSHWGRSIRLLSADTLTPLSDTHIHSPLPLDATPIPRSDAFFDTGSISSETLIVRYATFTGMRLAPMPFNGGDVSRQESAPRARRVDMDPAPSVFLDIEAPPYDETDRVLPMENYDVRPFIRPRYWLPIVMFDTDRRWELGFITGSRDPAGVFFYDTLTRFQISPFIWETTFRVQWPKFTHAWRISAFGSHNDRGAGAERESGRFGAGPGLSVRLSRPWTLSADLLYQPIYNRHGRFRQRISLPARLTLNESWGRALYAFGWRCNLEALLDAGTVHTDGAGNRAWNADRADGPQTAWNADLRLIASLTHGLPLGTPTIGLHQTLNYIVRQPLRSSLGAFVPELVANRFYPTLSTRNLLPLHSNIVLYQNNHALIHKARAFLLITRPDIRLKPIPITLHAIWIESIWDTAYAPDTDIFFGSYGARLSLDTTIGYHVKTSFQIALINRWIRHVDMDNLFVHLSLGFSLYY